MTNQGHLPGGGLAEAAAAMFSGILADSHLVPPGGLIEVFAERLRYLGVNDLHIYLIDYEQADLVPVTANNEAGGGVLRVEGTIGGRVFASSTILDAESDQEGRRELWLPLVDGTERLGVASMTVPATDGTVDPGLADVCRSFAHLATTLLVAKNLYGDAFEGVRRRQPMTVAAELQRALIPPSTFASRGFVISGVMEPCYRAGGDTFDYAVNGGVAHLAVFDAMGHGLSAAVTASVALAAYRNSRRRLLDLTGTYAAIDAALLDQFSGERFATAILARIDLHTGVLHWLSAGHLPPLLLRGGKLVKILEDARSTPLGMPFGERPVRAGREPLEPGDRLLLYTDGLTEARTAEGQFFTAERLAEFLERQSAAGLPAPETLRRLRHAIVTYQQGKLQDDATALLMEWRRDTEDRLVPQVPPTPA